MNVKELKEFIKDLPDDLVVVGDDTFSLNTELCETKARTCVWYCWETEQDIPVLEIYTSC